MLRACLIGEGPDADAVRDAIRTPVSKAASSFPGS